MSDQNQTTNDAPPPLPSPSVVILSDVRRERHMEVVKKLLRETGVFYVE